MKQVYFDYNATTPVNAAVLEAMLPFLKDSYGNPSSAHWAGRAAKNAIGVAREKVALLLSASADGLVFCSSGTEALNLAIKGAWFQRPEKKHFITTVVEHNGVIVPHKWLEGCGAEVTFLPVDREGRLNLDLLSSSIRPDTNLISVMMANNETGILFPVEKIAAIAKEKGVWFLCDAVQAAGKIPLDVKKIPFDFLALSGHKFYAPKGSAALFVRDGIKLNPLIHGGGHEKNRRAGTENVAGIVGLGAAAESARVGMNESESRLHKFQQKVEGVLAGVAGVMVVGKNSPRMPNTTAVIFDGVNGESLLMNLDLEGIAVSSGSACSSGKPTPPRVLTAMGFDGERAKSSLRISYGVPTSDEEIDYLLKVLLEVLARLKK